MAIAVVIVDEGGLPVTVGPDGYGVPMVEAENGIGIAVTIVEEGGGGLAVSGISGVLVGSPVNSVAPVISGTTTIGQTLSCTTGTWSGTPTSYAYSWRRNGAAISGATGTTYVLTAADNAAAMTCRVTASNAIGAGTPVVSNTLTLSDVTPANTVAPVISGTLNPGDVLSATTGSWTNTPSSYTYQWTRAGSAIGSATASTYTLVSADQSAAIGCQVTAVKLGVSSAAASSNTLTVGSWLPVNTVAPVISGTATVGQTLSSTTGTWSYSPSSYAYQWQRDAGNITGATSSTYLLAAPDEDASITCRVTATNSYGAAAAAATSNTLIVSGESETIVTAPNGMWWKFAGALTNGVYINGDPWVYNGGGAGTVSLIEVSTAPTGTGASARHGGMINPTHNDLAYTLPLGMPFTDPMRQGYDGRIENTIANGISGATWGDVYVYDETLNAHADLPLSMTSGQSLVSAVSINPELDFEDFYVAANRIAIERFACVTIVNYIPEADEFRPGYSGTDKRRFRFSDLNLALLPDLTAPFNPVGVTSDDFHFDEDSAYIGAPDHAYGLTRAEEADVAGMKHLWYWVWSLGTSHSASLFLAPYNMPFHAEIGREMGRMAMYVLCDFADRDLYLARFVQIGIDAFSVLQSGGFAFCGGAGFYTGPVWPIRFAGLLLDDEDMLAAPDAVSGREDYEEIPISWWGDKNRVYLSTIAHAQYIRVPGQDYTAGFPLFGDSPYEDVSDGPSDNGTTRPPVGGDAAGRIYDMEDYLDDPLESFGNLPNASFPDILTDAGDYAGETRSVYECYKYAGVEMTNLGTYMSQNTKSQMGYICASIAMDDEAMWGSGFYGNAVVPFARRYAYDPQMWPQFGWVYDYSGMESAHWRDIDGHGGTGNGWMAQMWDLVVGIPTEAPTEFEQVTFGSGDYMTRGAGLTGVSDGEQFTFVIRCRPIDTGTVRNLIVDQASNIVISHRVSNAIQVAAWGAAQRIDGVSTGLFSAADGMQTIFISGRTTSGSTAFHIYKGDTSMAPGGGSVIATGSMDFTATNWGLLAYTDGSNPWTGDVEFIWFDTVYYDVTDPDVRLMWLAENIGSDGSGPGAQPKIYLTGDAAAWNSDTLNLGTGGGFTMTGTVTDTADVTAPTLSAAAATSTGTTTGSLAVTTDESGGTLYWVVTTSATPPSAAQVKLGQNHASAAAPDSGNQAVSSTGAQSVTGGATGLTASTAYYAYFMHEDAATNQSTVATDGFTTDTADSTAPVLSSPVATELSSSTASLTVTTDEANGTLYWVVTISATPPSKAQIKAGQNQAGAAAPDSGSQAVSGTGAQSISGGAAGLTASTAYYAYFMHEDTAANQSNVATDGFTTSAPASSFTTVTFGSGDGLTKAAAPAPDSTEFTLVVRCQVVDSGTARIFINDNAGWIDARVSAAASQIASTFWNASSVSLSSSGSTEDVVNAAGMVTIFIAGRTTGTPIIQCYLDSTNAVLTGLTQTSGTIKFNVPNWNVLSPFLGDVQFFWFDTVYYDISNSGVRDDWLAANIGANGSGPGAQPKIYFTGNAAAWNSGVNLGTGGNFTMSGAVT